MSYIYISSLKYDSFQIEQFFFAVEVSKYS